MRHSNWIMPRAESQCGRVFLPNRKAAEEHRVALQVWISATRHDTSEYGLVTYRCARCGGYHVGRRKNKPVALPFEPGLEGETRTGSSEPHAGQVACALDQPQV